jgi:hypothetical protein
MLITDEQLQELITKICKNPDPKSWERRQAMNRLLITFQQLPGLRKSPHLDYLEALDKTWEWASKNICDFNPRPHLSIQQSLVNWINGYLYWRIQDLYQRADRNQYSLDSVIDNSGENGKNWLEQRSIVNSDIPVLSGIDDHIEKVRKQEIQVIFLELELYIEQDPERKLRSCHPRKSPECNCQILSQRLLLKNPPDRLADISQEFGIKYQTLNSHWNNKCKPLLQTIVVSLGYSRNEES